MAKATWRKQTWWMVSEDSHHTPPGATELLHHTHHHLVLILLACFIVILKMQKVMGKNLTLCCTINPDLWVGQLCPLVLLQLGHANVVSLSIPICIPGIKESVCWTLPVELNTMKTCEYHALCARFKDLLLLPGEPAFSLWKRCDPAAQLLWGTSLEFRRCQ